jgi:hypothetical protein
VQHVLARQQREQRPAGVGELVVDAASDPVAGDDVRVGEDGQMFRDRARREAEPVGYPCRGERSAELAQDRSPAAVRSRSAPAPRAWKETARTSGSSVE